jgi:hypothetical protein
MQRSGCWLGRLQLCILGQLLKHERLDAGDIKPPPSISHYWHGAKMDKSKRGLHPPWSQGQVMASDYSGDTTSDDLAADDTTPTLHAEMSSMPYTTKLTATSIV